MHFFLQRETLVIVQFRLGIFFPEVIGSEGQSDAFARLEPFIAPLSLWTGAFVESCLCCSWLFFCISLLFVVLKPVVLLWFAFVGYSVVVCFCWLFCFVLFLLGLFGPFCLVFQFLVCSFGCVLFYLLFCCLFWFVLFVSLLFVASCFPP